jgi:hypothetical protein
MKNTKRKIFGSILLYVVGSLVSHYLYGRLMRFSPLVAGFETYTSKNAIVNFHENET